MNQDCFICLECIVNNPDINLKELVKKTGLKEDVIESYIKYLLYWKFIKEHLEVKMGEPFELGHYKTYYATDKGKSKVKAGWD